MIVADHCCLDIVLHFGLGLLSRMLVLEVKGGGKLVWQLRREVNLIDSRLQDTPLDIKYTVLVLQELLGMLELLLTMDSPIAILFSVVTNERALFTALELKLDVRRIGWLHDLHVDDARHGVSWLVEGILGLQLDLAFRELAPFIREEKHCCLV